MKVVIIGKKTREIDGDYIEFNPRTFIRDVEGYEQIIYIGEDFKILKAITMSARSMGKDLIYIGSIDPSYATRKYPATLVYRSVKDYAGPKKGIEVAVEESATINSFLSNYVSDDVDVLTKNDDGDE